MSSLQAKKSALSMRPSAPIGVFDSGVGGLSVLRQLLRILPHEDFIYLADTAYAPYGERSSEQIKNRCKALTRFLIQYHGIKALVIACNTATAHAAQHLRDTFPTLPLVGIEPALKPAVALSQTGCVGVMATQGTVQSAKFGKLVQDWSGACQVRVQACNGLALAIENALDHAANQDGETVRSLCQRYTNAMQPFVGNNSAGSGTDLAIDVLVLGCTHYPFAEPVLRQILGDTVKLIEPGEPVALQTQRLLAQKKLQCTQSYAGQVTMLATAAPQRLQQASYQWLNLQSDVQLLAIE